MDAAAAFLVSVAAGAALLALWVDVRRPGLAPRGLGRRFVAAVLACVLLRLVPPGVEAILAADFPPAPRALGAAGVFVAGVTFTFLTALWLLRALAEVRAIR